MCRQTVQKRGSAPRRRVLRVGQAARDRASTLFVSRRPLTAIAVRRPEKAKNKKIAVKVYSTFRGLRVLRRLCYNK